MPLWVRKSSFILELRIDKQFEPFLLIILFVRYVWHGGGGEQAGRVACRVVGLRAGETGGGDKADEQSDQGDQLQQHGQSLRVPGAAAAEGARRVHRHRHPGHQQTGNPPRTQKEVIRQMKNLQRQVKELRMPAVNLNRIIAQSQELLKLRQESDKNNKLSTGMIMALGKI